MHSTNDLDRQSYQTWQRTQEIVTDMTTSSLDRVADYWRHIIAAYPYFRSRLLAPGRAYDSEEDGMLAIGGSAHCDVMDLDVKLAGMSPQARQTAINWMDDTSPDDVAYWRKLGRGSSRWTIQRRRNELIQKLDAPNSGESVVDSMSDLAA